MKTDQRIEFTHDSSCFIRIESIEKFEDGSGFCSILNMQSGAFSCQGHPFYFNHLNQFAKALVKLNKKLKGNAELRPDYEPEFIRFAATSLGHITVQGELHEHGDHPQLFRFSFETDQSYLPPFLESLNATLNSLK